MSEPIADLPGVQKGHENNKASGNLTAQDAAKELGRRGGLKGGKARAARLTSEERSEIARSAVEARWAKARDQGEAVKPALPRATHGSEDHPLTIFDIEIPCYVLSDGTRVITNRGLQRSLGMAESGGAQRLVDLMERFRAKGVDVKDLPARILSPIEFRPKRGRSAYGYEATVLADLCDVILDARAVGAITSKFDRRLAEQGEILVRGFARVGIIALVDEATGYQEERDRHELHRILELYIAKDLLPWTKRFPDEFYQQLFRLRGWDYPPENSKRPRIVGKLTETLIYKRLPPGVLEDLRSKNPVAYKGGSRKQRHHQLLTAEVGNPHLEKQLVAVTTIMRIARDWHEFVELFERSDPNSPHQSRLRLELEDD